MPAPVAIGPQSRTIIGAIPKGAVPPPKKPLWKKLVIPGAIAGSILLVMRAKGHL